jgi:hypothetical protein
MTLAVSPATAQQQFGSFFLYPELPTIIVLNGPIDDRSGLEFRRVLTAAPAAKVVMLNSPGGSVQMGLLIAEEIHERRLSTFIPEEFECSSACSWVFFAGASRVALGRLGVHQISGVDEDNSLTQLNLSDIAESLHKYGTPPEVLATMLRTPPDSMYYFSKEEITRLGLNRESSVSAAASTLPDRSGTMSQEPTQASLALQVVDSLINAHTESETAALALVRQMYARQITYFGKPTPLDDVVADKQRYFKRHPVRRVQVIDDSVSVSCSDNLCTVFGRYNWDISGREGIAIFTYTVDMRNTPVVVAEGGAVSTANGVVIPP